MSAYYLVAKSKNSKQFNIIKIKGNEIYSDYSDLLERSFNLEKLDLFTSRFNSEKDLIKYLKDNNRIDFDDCDIFIVSRNGKNIKFLNCIYNFSNSVSLLRKVMVESDQSKLNKDSINVSNLLDDFIYNIIHNKKFYNLVIYGYTDIYKKFYEYFKGRNVDQKELFGAKYRDGRWAMSSYNLHRSIIDAYQLYNKFYKCSDMLTSVFNYTSGNRKNRNSIIGEIRVCTDKDYVDGQISLFDIMNEDTKIVSREDKLIEVMSYLDRFPRGMFIGDDLEFNQKIFSGIGSSDLNKISVRLKRLINCYTVSKYHYDKAIEYDGNTRELSRDLVAYKKGIMKLLESDSILDKFYNFCKLYDKIKEEYDSKVRGDLKVYGKKEDN